MDQLDSTQSKRMDRNTRREAILKATLEIFNEKGYEGTSLNAIIKRVGGSKRNFYTEFGGKEGLFRALLSERVERQIQEQALDDAVEKDLRATLLGMARRMVRGFSDPELLALYRFMVQDGIRFPGVVKAFYEVAHLRGEAYIASLLEKAADRGEVRLYGDPSVMAGHFLSMLHGGPLYELLFNIRDELTSADADAFVGSAVDLFLNGIGERRAPGEAG